MMAIAMTTIPIPLAILAISLCETKAEDGHDVE
jgi:hypothetical protein